MLRQAVILVGGLGTRLGERTKTTPKPMLPVGGRPFLDTLIDEIARYDAFEEILLLAGHKAESIQARYDGTVRGRARLAVSLEQAPLGTAGALVHAAGLLQERFLLSTAIRSSTSTSSIWPRAPTPALFTWPCAPTSWATGSAGSCSTAIGFARSSRRARARPVRSTPASTSSTARSLPASAAFPLLSNRTYSLRSPPPAP